MSRISLAFQSFFGLLFQGKLPDAVLNNFNLTKRVMGPPPASVKGAAPQTTAAPPVSRPSDGAVQVLALLQREGRFIDFLQEDIGPYSDEQVGSVVRDVHKQCRDALARHFTISPIVDGIEGDTTRLAAAGLKPTDTTRLKIVGKVPADGNVEAGVLRHRGWKADKIDLPALKSGERLTVIAPAEIEVE